ncbi:unnamed protein product [Rotaria sp. Silwood2]|nr:unnamed protein product [Rotaria sp. Silwood2]
MVQRRKLPNGQNLMCIVYHDEKLPLHHLRQLRSSLYQIFDYSSIFSDLRKFSTYINDKFIVNKIVFILSGNQAHLLCCMVQSRTQSPKNPFLYELQFGQEKLQSNLANGQRFQNIDRLVDKIVDNVKEYIKNEDNHCKESIENDELILQRSALSFSIYDQFQEQQSLYCLPRESLKFLLFQSFVEELLIIEDKKEDLEKMWSACRYKAINENNGTYLGQIDEFKSLYDPNKAIQFYSKNSFLFRWINAALRCENMEKIFTFHPFITHLHKQLTVLSQQQGLERSSSPYTLYRGKKLPRSILQQLSDNKNNLISMKGFLSTTTNSDVANMFADPNNIVMGNESVIFEMHLDDTQLNEMIRMKRPYANISTGSDHGDENEVLFFMGFIWCIKSVEPTSDNNWKIELELSADIASQMNNNFKEWKSESTYFTLGKILHELGEYTNAIEFYKRMFTESSNLLERTRTSIYHYIAKSEYANGSYQSAYDNLEQAEKILENISKSNDEINLHFRSIYAEDAEPSPMCITMNMGLVHRQMNHYEQARHLFNEALQKHGSTTDKAILYNSIGGLNFQQGNYYEALNNYLEALKLTIDQSLKAEINQRINLLNERLHR